MADAGSSTQRWMCRNPSKPQPERPPMDKTIAGISIPDTPLVRDTTNLVREAMDDVIYHHSRCVFIFGALQGRRRSLAPNLELLYVGAMFHDLGLTARYGTPDHRFEVDGANAARAFLSTGPMRRRQIMYGSPLPCTQLRRSPSSSSQKSPW